MSETNFPVEMTAREAEIARLVSDGLTNQEIADQLSLKPPTVAAHLRQIYLKCSVRNRVELTRLLYS